METHEINQFLVAANTAAKVHDYFHWRVVGRMLDWPERKSIRAIETLRDDMGVIWVRGEEAKLLPEGRVLAEKLNSQAAVAMPVPAALLDSRPVVNKRLA